jgi:hypothetical protein
MANDIIGIVVTDNSDNVQINATPNLVSINVTNTSGNIIGYNYYLASTFGALPAIGENTVLYVVNTTSLMYRWNGSAYVQINSISSINWGNINGTLSNQTDLQNALNAKAPLASPTFTGTVSGITKAMVGLGNVDNTTDLLKPISTATQTALNLKYDATNPAGYTTNVGTVTSVGALTLSTSGTDVSSTVANGTTTPAITLNIPTASATNRGALSSNDWTTFNNKANALSGTTNYVPKFTSGSSIGNSLIFDNGTNVGIGVTNPANLLSVNGTVGATAFTDGYITMSAAQINRADAPVELQYNATAGVRLFGNTSNLITFFPNGNVVIGQSPDAGYKLDVTGTARVSGILTFGSTISNGTFAYTLPSASGTLALTSALSNYLPLTGGTLTGALTGTNATFSGAVTNQVTNISSDGAGVVLQGYIDNFLRIAVRGSGYNNGGRGGLLASTGDFSSTLVVSGAATFSSSVTASSLIKSGGTSVQYLMADGSVSTLTNPITGTGTTNYVPKFTSGSAIGNSLIYDNGTNVLIGTTTDSGYKLDVNGTGRFSGNLSGTNATFSGNVGIGSPPTQAAQFDLFGSDQASLLTYSGFGNRQGSDFLINSYRLPGGNLFQRVSDIVSLGDDTNNRESIFRFITTNTSNSTATRLTISGSEIIASVLSTFVGGATLKGVCKIFSDTTSAGVVLQGYTGGLRIAVNGSSETGGTRGDLLASAGDFSSTLNVTGAATFSSSVTATSYNLSALNTAPASATATGTLGQIRIDDSFIYVCTATNTWKRAAITTWV